MAYAISQLDKDNLKWFAENRARNTLAQIKVENGNIRGVFPCEMTFKYPISALVGENGSGKSTLLALSACAYHNTDSFYQFGRKKSYFTFGDFFTFTPNEEGLGGIRITYNIRKADRDEPESRWKKPSGKWNDFNTRSKRNVVYLGINRIVPPSESSAHRSYSRRFESFSIDEALSQKLIQIAGRIFDKNYSGLEILGYKNYRIYYVRKNSIGYSGFNMGAGENAVFTILLELISAGIGALLVIDEIELGLHAKAQKAFINELKLICKENQCQVICSTHSDIILNALPPQARFFINSKSQETVVTPEISSQYAFGKLMGQNTEELKVFVEDEVGQALLTYIVPLAIRERIKIVSIGSDQAVLRQMASYYREGLSNYIAFLDGDKRSRHSQSISQIRNYLEGRVSSDFDSAVTSMLHYLPGNTWPERHIIEQLLRLESRKDLSEHWDVLDENDIMPFLEQALAAGKHNEFFSLSQHVFHDEESVRADCIKCFKKNYVDECAEIVNQLNLTLVHI